MSTDASWRDTEAMGATFATRNGVSEGIALIQPELAMLDRTVAANIVLLQQLTKLGATLPALSTTMAPIHFPANDQLVEVADLALPESDLRRSATPASTYGQMGTVSHPVGPFAGTPWQSFKMTAVSQPTITTIAGVEGPRTPGTRSIVGTSAPSTARFNRAHVPDVNELGGTATPFVPLPEPAQSPQLAVPNGRPPPKGDTPIDMPDLVRHAVWPGFASDSAGHTTKLRPSVPLPPDHQRSLAAVELTTHLPPTSPQDASYWPSRERSASLQPTIRIRSMPNQDVFDTKPAFAPTIDSVTTLPMSRLQMIYQPIKDEALAPTGAFLQPEWQEGTRSPASSERATSELEPEAEASARPSGSRPQSSAATEPWQGTIFLDGARLGRWVVDHLAKTVSRPATGTTGIDPRINAIYPGASTGV